MFLIILIVFVVIAYIVFCQITDIDFNEFDFGDLGTVLYFIMVLFGVYIMGVAGGLL